MREGARAAERPASGRRILGVFAHPDDEVFCAGGTFARYAEAGAEVHVVSATRGQAGQIRDPAVATRRTLGAVREAELQAACAALGVARAVCWDYEDGRLADARDLPAAVASLIRELDPHVVVTFGPDGLYGHPDHVAVGAATTSAFLEAAATRPGERRLYHSCPPQRSGLLLERLAGWLTGLDASFRGDQEFLRCLALFSHETATLRYISDHVEVEWFPPGVSIVEQGERGDNLYLILSGSAVALQEEADGALRALGSLDAGQFFGELAVAGGGVRSAHVRAETAVTCLVLSPAGATAYAGRGDGAALVGDRGRVPDGATAGTSSRTAVGDPPTTVVDVTAQVGRKLAALAAHRTQHAVDTRFLPPDLLEELFGSEPFRRVHPPPPLERGLLPDA